MAARPEQFQFRHFDDCQCGRPPGSMASLLGSAPATSRYILEALEDGYVETNMVIPQQAAPALSEH
jgi:hypothetical protein